MMDCNFFTKTDCYKYPPYYIIEIVGPIPWGWAVAI